MPAASCRPSPRGSNRSCETDSYLMSSKRIFNFSAGPAVLPLPVLEEAQRDLVSLPGVGMSVMEISHRSKAFEDILNRAIADMRELAGIPDRYKLVMLQGGASLQFSMVPMNFLTPGTTADYVDTGTWADKAIKEAKKVGKVNVTGSTKADNYNRIPSSSEISLTAGAAHVHITTKKKIEGTQGEKPPGGGGNPPVTEASSGNLPGPPHAARVGPPSARA